MGRKPKIQFIAFRHGLSEGPALSKFNLRKLKSTDQCWIAHEQMLLDLIRYRVLVIAVLRYLIEDKLSHFPECAFQRPLVALGPD